MSQEIDHPDQADGVPHDRGWLLVRHIAAPAVGLVPFALLGAAVVAAAEPAAWAGALAVAIPIMWLGVGGAAVSILRDAPDPLSPPVASSAAVPPEFAGFTSTFRAVWPIAISALATVPVLAMREQPTPAPSPARSPGWHSSSTPWSGGCADATSGGRSGGTSWTPGGGPT